MSPIFSEPDPSAAPPSDVVAIADDVLEHLGSRIASYRATRGLTLAQTAKALHTTATVLARWEAGDMASATYFQVLGALDWIRSGQ